VEKAEENLLAHPTKEDGEVMGKEEGEEEDDDEGDDKDEGKLYDPFYDDAEDDAVITMQWGKAEIDHALNIVTQSKRYQYKQVVRTQVPPFHNTKYDLVVPKKVVLEMKRFITMNPEGVYTFAVSPSERHRADLEAEHTNFVKLKVRPEVAAREKGMWKSKIKELEKQH